MAQAPAAGGPITTIPPFSDSAKLPACATLCGHLYDANGACVPPQIATNTAASAQTACFCSNTKVAPFSTGISGVCDNVCPDAQMTSIANWFQSVCGVQNNAGDGGNTANGQQSSSSTSSASGSKSSSSSGSGGGGGGDWLSTHYQWVIMIVILVIGIAGIWIGACIWRRRYLRKKDRQHLAGQKQSGSPSHPSWGPPPIANSESGVPMTYTNNRDSEAYAPKPDKNDKKKWRVSRRT